MNDTVPTDDDDTADRLLALYFFDVGYHAWRYELALGGLFPALLNLGEEAKAIELRLGRVLEMTSSLSAGHRAAQSLLTLLREVERLRKKEKVKTHLWTQTSRQVRRHGTPFLTSWQDAGVQAAEWEAIALYEADGTRAKPGHVEDARAKLLKGLQRGGVPEQGADSIIKHRRDGHRFGATAAAVRDWYKGHHAAGLRQALLNQLTSEHLSGRFPNALLEELGCSGVAVQYLKVLYDSRPQFISGTVVGDRLHYSEKNIAYHRRRIPPEIIKILLHQGQRSIYGWKPDATS